MKHLLVAGVILLFGAPFLAAAEEVIVDLDVYMGSFESQKMSQIWVSLPANRLTPTMGMGLLDEMKKTFHFKEIRQITTPRLQTEIGREADFRQSFNDDSLPFLRIHLSVTVFSVEHKKAHMKIGFSCDDEAMSGAELFAGVGQAVMLANRLNGEILFIQATVQQPLGTVILPKVVRQVDPVYPLELIEEKINGKVVLEVDLAADGSLEDARVLRTDHPGFTEPALAAIRGWVFEPQRRDGKPEKCTITVEIAFTLY
jgi:TonB family protein